MCVRRIYSIYMRIYVMMIEIKLEIRDREITKARAREEKLCHIFLSSTLLDGFGILITRNNMHTHERAHSFHDMMALNTT